MTADLVLYEHRRAAAVLTMNRADKRNALSRGLIAALTDAFRRAQDDTAARCVLLTGAGPAFCAGMDLGELSQTIDAPDRGEIWESALNLAKLFDLIYSLPKPTIAVVNGPAVAGGAGLVSVCDLAMAAAEAKFGYPEVRRGLVAAMVMPHLLRHVGERLARWLLLSGELIDAEAAVRCGLINAVVPADRLQAESDAWVRSLAAGGPEALRNTKDILHRLSHQAMSIEQAAQASATPRLNDECRAGLKAFFAKRPAPWEPSTP
ncbi:MAG TPA: enoyl-CoA hydratase-related protein [Gemmataceae bacterium]|nr:enoyl-CoA hydratase-related protein [Gemmataceae bacterium]